MMRTCERQAGARQPATLGPEGAERGDGVSGPREGGERVGRSGRPGDTQAGRGSGAPSALPCSEAHPENQANNAPKRVFI